jgi:hypothetical protein
VIVFAGGQTGVDRAGLDAALVVGLPIGGWCPAKRRAEDGRIPDTYPLVETESSAYEVRTEWNARDTAATLIVADDDNALGRGTVLAIAMAKKHKKLLFISRCYRANLVRDGQEIAAIRCWLAQHQPPTLNVAGPRESRSPGIQKRATAFLVECFRA